MQSNTREPDIRWLIIGAIVGLIIAGIGILKKSSIDSYLPPNSIARVNDHFISNEAYLSAVNRQLASDEESNVPALGSTPD